MTRDRSDDIRAAWQRVRDLRLAMIPGKCGDIVPRDRQPLITAAREYLRLSGSVGEAACYAALGGIEAEIARLTCEELIR